MILGIFGGTFNPIHLGHITIAIQIYKRFFLNYVYFIPLGQPPHKTRQELNKGDYRLEIIARALPSKFPFRVSKVEIIRAGTTYTIDTVSYCKSLIKKGDKLFLILGIDAFLEIHTWKKYRDLISQVNIVVVSRNGLFSPEDSNFVRKLHRYIGDNFSFQSSFLYHNGFWTGKSFGKIYYFRIKSPKLSSSKIRVLIKKSITFNFILPLVVFYYIRKKGLYL